MMPSRVIDWLTAQAQHIHNRTSIYPGSPEGRAARDLMEIEDCIRDVQRTERGLVLASQEIARQKLLRNRDETGEDFGEEHVRLAGADEMREIMARVDRGEGGV